MGTFNIEPGTSWDQVELELRRLAYNDLLREYHRYLSLCAKSVKDLRLEVMLENEIARREP